MITSTLSFILGIIIITLFYNLSSNLKNFYLDLKSNYTEDDKYLAVITKNGLWIKDIVDNETLIINAVEIKENQLINSYISVFNDNFEIVKNIVGPKIDVSNKEWIINEAEIFENNEKQNLKNYKIKTNFDYQVIQNLFSNLSSLSFFELIELRKNYKSLNYSLVEIDIQIIKIITFPLYLVLMTIFSSIIMLNTKQFKSSTIKISIGLFFSVIIYYFFNFFKVLGETEKINLINSILVPLVLLTILNTIMIRKI